MLKTRGGLVTGETVLIHAAGSGIGSVAIQISKLSGAEVITTVGNDEKVEKATGALYYLALEQLHPYHSVYNWQFQQKGPNAHHKKMRISTFFNNLILVSIWIPPRVLFLVWMSRN